MNPSPTAVIDMMNRIKQETACRITEMNIDADDYTAAEQSVRDGRFSWLDSEGPVTLPLSPELNAAFYRMGTRLLKITGPTILAIREVYLWITLPHYRKYGIQAYADRSGRKLQETYTTNAQTR